jgi:hypothetical protein
VTYENFEFSIAHDTYMNWTIVWLEYDHEKVVEKRAQ